MSVDIEREREINHWIRFYERVEFWWAGASAIVGGFDNRRSISFESNLWFGWRFPCGWFGFSHRLWHLSSETCEHWFPVLVAFSLPFSIIFICLNIFHAHRLRVQLYHTVSLHCRIQTVRNCFYVMIMKVFMSILLVEYPRISCYRYNFQTDFLLYVDLEYRWP